MAGSDRKKLGGKKGRKIGRESHHPAHMRYNGTCRWETNKKRRMAKQAKFEAKKRNEKQVRLILRGIIALSKP